MMMKILINKKANEPHWIQSVPVSLVKFSHSAKNGIFLVSIFLMCALVYGFSLLKVENRFIDYFSDDTEIYQGMYLLDKELGGTATLDIVIDAPKESIEDIDLDDDLFDDEIILATFCILCNLSPGLTLSGEYPRKKLLPNLNFLRMGKKYFLVDPG